MARVAEAFIELGTLIGFFEPGGAVRWQWFADPRLAAFQALPGERERIGAIIRALVERDQTTGPFTGTGDSPTNGWEPILEFDGADTGFGVTWSMPTTSPLVIGLGAKGGVAAGGQQFTLAVLARVLRVIPDSDPDELGEVEHALGEIEVDGSFPVPDFLASGSVTATIDVPEATIGLKAVAPAPAGEREVTYDVPDGDPEMLGWDASRLATFVLKAFIIQKAGENDTFSQRVLEHLFPMMGDPAGEILPLPIVDQPGAPVDFDDWSGSVVPTGNATGALLFLWHLRALLTGNEDPDFLTGSLYFPLVEGSPEGQAPTSLAQAVGAYENVTGPSAWVGMVNEAGGFTLVLDLWNAAGTQRRIPIATWNGSVLSRPTFTGGAIPAGFGGSMVDIDPEGITLLEEEIDSEVYRLKLRTDVAAGQPPRIEFQTPFVTLTFPPPSAPAEATEFAGEVTSSLVKYATEETEFSAVATALADVISAVTAGQAPSARDVLTAVLELAADTGTEISPPIGEGVTLTLGIQGDLLQADIAIGPISAEAIELVIGTVEAGIDIGLAGAPVLAGFRLAFTDLRIGEKGAAGGIVASLLPDLKEVPGFDLAVQYEAPSDVTVTGGGKIPIQRTIGPLEIAALLIELAEDSFAIGIDLGFELGPIAVAAYELGIRVGFNGDVEPFLHGLGLSMEADVVSLGGFFAAVESTDENGDTSTDYVGGALVSVAGYFQLSAIGGYTQLPDGDPSLFIFASLVAPLGGPPWFFMTGVAGGFGLNRALPNPELMLEHPFLRVMRGELDISGDAANSLKKLSVEFFVEAGQFWVAAGIQFISFGFITGRVVIAISFGHKFSFTILGMASFSLEPLAYIEIGILTTVDEEKFVLRASLSPNSYVLHPDIFSLQGDIALCAWYALPHKGDFLFSIGGYHPDWKKPDHYPELVRVGARASLYGFVNLSVEVFFACTPQALMAGAKVAVWGEFVGIAAGCEVYVHVLMTWDPFYIRAGIGVVLWFEFFGRHEIGVHLDIYTPEFGGTATIDLAIVSFEVDFGAKVTPPPKPTIAEFFTRQLALPATQPSTKTRVAAFNADDAAGLFRIEVQSGRAGGEPPAQEEQQEGLSAGAPIHVSPEWTFLFRTRLPFAPENLDAALDGLVVGEANAPLTGKFDLKTVLGLSVTAQLSGGTTLPLPVGREWLIDYFPAATFGQDPLPEADGDASGTIASIKSDAPSVELAEGFFVDCSAQIAQPSEALAAEQVEESDADERYPLPLGAGPGPVLVAVPHEPLHFAPASHLAFDITKSVSRRAAALADLRARKRPPLHVLARSSGLLNAVAQSAGQTLTADITASAAVARMAPPASPARSTALAGVTLKILPVRSDHAVSRRGLEGPTRAPDVAERALTPKEGTTRGLRTTVDVAANEAHILEFRGGKQGATVQLAGSQQVRVVALDRGGNVLVDSYTKGKGAHDLPRGTGRLVTVGAGAASAPSTWGVERDTTLLAITRGVFLAPGCVVSSLTPLGRDIRPLDGMPGATLFEACARIRLDVGQATDERRALVIRVVPLVDRPDPASEQVRWRATGALLRDLAPVVSPDGATFVMAVQSEGAWSLDIDLGPQWQLDAVAVVPRTAREVVADLRQGSRGPLIDDAVPPPPARKNATKVGVQVRA